MLSVTFACSSKPLVCDASSESYRVNPWFLRYADCIASSTTSNLASLPLLLSLGVGETFRGVQKSHLRLLQHSWQISRWRLHVSFNTIVECRMQRKYFIVSGAQERSPTDCNSNSIGQVSIYFGLWPYPADSWYAGVVC